MAQYLDWLVDPRTPTTADYDWFIVRDKYGRPITREAGPQKVKETIEEKGTLLDALFLNTRTEPS